MISQIHVKKRNNSSTYIISFGDTSISLNSFIVIICGILSSIITFYLYPSRYDIVFVPIIITLLISYNIHCVEVGNCGMWSMILTCVYILNVFGMIYFLYNQNRINFNTGIDDKLQYLHSKFNRLMNPKNIKLNT